jgi:pyruvate formate lyase activating enzyme
MNHTKETTARIAGISRLRFETDGPGIRTLVALSGCNLDCAYCINGQFRKSSFGVEYTPEALLDQVLPDDIYFRASGGGITFGGGEPILHSGFIRRFREMCPKEWNIAVETSLNVPREDVERLLGLVDRWFIDIKSLEAERYLEYTGVPNASVTSNLTLLRERGEASKAIVRVPRIRGLNTPEDVRREAGALEAWGFETESFDYVIPDNLLKEFSSVEPLMGDLIDSEEEDSGGCWDDAPPRHSLLKRIQELLTTPLMGVLE